MGVQVNCNLPIVAAALLSLSSCAQPGEISSAKIETSSDPRLDPFWRNATVYFLLTDRFANGNTKNDHVLPTSDGAGPLRGFMGGDIAGVTHRIESGYFDALGVDAIWTTPLIENVHGSVYEGEWGRTYAYHGYWPRDWSKVDPRLGTESDLVGMIDAAHRRNIRIISDVIINHAGPETESGDPRWPDSWVRSGPSCTHESYKTTVTCELSFTLQDIRTESEAPVELPTFLTERWKAEGRLNRELSELEAFFKRTGYPRAPKYYIVKWLTDWVREYGIDGFRVDTAKHVDPEIWSVLKREAELALADWRNRNPLRPHDDKPFYMVGEVFNYGLLDFGLAHDRDYDYGDRHIDFYSFGFDALINMGFPTHSKMTVAQQYALLDSELNDGPFDGLGTLNYIASHDDMNPLDPQRLHTRESATRLMLSPGGAQIYYGDEVGRSLVIDGTRGDATLRSRFDWDAVETDSGILDHWRKLGSFRKAHLAIGAGRHRQISSKPFVFARVLNEGKLSDRVVVAMGLVPGKNQIRIGDVLEPGTRVRDAYTGELGVVRDGLVEFIRTSDVALIEVINKGLDPLP